MTPASRILVLAYGNPGRRDDGLGPALAALLDELHLPDVTVNSDYQLAVEDAATIAQHDVVVFIDADSAGPAPFSFYRIAPEHPAGFSTHSMTPQVVLGLAVDLFGARPAAYVFAIRGYEFDEFGEALTPAAAVNLALAAEFIEPVLRQRSFAEALLHMTGSRAPVAAASAKGDKQ